MHSLGDLRKKNQMYVMITKNLKYNIYKKEESKSKPCSLYDKRLEKGNCEAI